MSASPSAKGQTGAQARQAKRASAGTPSTAPASGASKPKPKYDEGSRQLAALGYGLLVLLGAPVLSLDYVTDSGSTRFLQFSPPHVASLAILDYAPALTPLAHIVMLPATYMQAVSMTVRYCMEKDQDRCSIKRLLDAQLMLKEADVSYLLPTFQKAFERQYLNLLYAGGLIVTFTAVVGLYKPVRMGVMGFMLLVAAAYFTEDAGLMPTLIMEAFLGIYVLFFDPVGMEKDEQRRAAKKAAEDDKKRKKKGGAASGPTTPEPASKASAGTPSSASQRKNRVVDKKNLYDI